MNRIKELWSAIGRRRQAYLTVLLAAVLLMATLVLVLAAMNGDKANQKTSGNSESVSKAATSRAEVSATATTTETTPEADDLSSEFRGPFTNLPVSEEEYGAFADRRALMVSYDNINYAWPQAGVTYADFTVEILAEGLITRLLGVFFANPPDYVGPIRSARPYIVVKALEYDAYLAHVGGSQQALSDIVSHGAADLDGLWSGAFERRDHKSAPHNTYAVYEDLISEAKRQGYRSSGSTDFYGFDAESPAGAQGDANHLAFEYRKPYTYGDAGYVVEFYYDEATNSYFRYVNGEQYFDEIDGNPFAVSNIVVQYAEHSVLDGEGRLAIDLFSGGQAYQFRDGKVYALTWSKDDYGSLTDFAYEDGSKILLTPGRTAFLVVYPGIFAYDENNEGIDTDD